MNKRISPSGSANSVTVQLSLYDWTHGPHVEAFFVISVFASFARNVHLDLAVVLEAVAKNTTAWPVVVENFMLMTKWTGSVACNYNINKRLCFPVLLNLVEVAQVNRITSRNLMPPIVDYVRERSNPKQIAQNRESERYPKV